MPTENPKLSAREEYGAIQGMLASTGWKLLQERLSLEGDGIMGKILDKSIDKDEREKLVYELSALSRWPNIIEQFKIDAENERLNEEVTNKRKSSGNREGEGK